MTELRINSRKTFTRHSESREKTKMVNDNAAVILLVTDDLKRI